MKRQTKILGLVLAVTMSSCTHYYYIQNTHNVPLFKEKNEFRATVAIGEGDEIGTTDIQTAYSITNNLAVMTNFMSGHGEGNSEFGRGKYIDGAIGYYKPLGKFCILEVYGGIGRSNQHHQYSGSSTADLSFTKIFTQPSFGLTFKAFDIAISTRFSKLSFNNINNQIRRNVYDYRDVNAIMQNKNSYLFEPALTIRGGWKYLKLQLQASFTKNLTHPDLSFETSALSIGLYFTIAKRYRTTKRKELMSIN